MKPPTAVPPAEHPKFWILGDHLTFKLGPERSGGRFVVIEARRRGVDSLKT